MDRASMLRVTVGSVIIAALLSILGGIAYLLYGPGVTITVPDFFATNKSTSTESTGAPAFLSEQAGTLFECEDGRSLKAEFLQRAVGLSLSDGRQLRLPETTSSAGTRYANTNESFVFWNSDDAAFVEENGAKTYVNCVLREL